MRYLMLVVALSFLCAWLLYMFPDKPKVDVRLLGLIAPETLFAGESYAVFAGLSFSEPGDYVMQLRACNTTCRVIRVGIKAKDTKEWWGWIASINLEPGMYQIRLNIGNRQEIAFLRSFAERRWSVSVK